MAALYEQDFPASTAALSAVRAAVREVCRQVGCGDECSDQVVLAVNEACMNIIQHGYRFADGHCFALRLSVDDGMLTVCLLDRGVAVSAADLRPRELDELRPGGLGVHFIRELMDEVGYLPAPNGFTNCLQLRKRIC